MKTLLTLIALSLILGLSSWEWKRDKIKGSGNIAEETRTVGDFDKIKVSGGINIVLAQGPVSEVIAQSDDNLLSYIETRTEDHTLIVSRGTNKNLDSRHGLIVYVTVPDLKEITASAASDIIGKTPWKVENLKISVSSASDLDLAIEADELQLQASSASDVDLEGKITNFTASFSSASDFNGKHLNIQKAKVKASGASSISLWVEEELSYSVSGASDLTYYGNPRIISARSGAASDVTHRSK